MVVARRADEIAEIASRLFYEQGYARVTTRALAEAAGIKGGSLYHHFSSKEEILYRIVQLGSDEFFARLVPHLQSGLTHAERLDSFVRAYVTGSRERRHAIGVLFRDMGHLSPEHYLELALARRRFQQTLQAFLAEGVAAGAFSVPDPKVAGIAILDLLKGADTWVREPGRLTRRQVAQTYATLVRQMMGA